MKSTKGLFLDAGLIDTPQGYSPFIKNAILTDKIGSIINEKGFNIFSQVPYTINGILVAQNDIIVFNTNDTISEIGKVNLEGVYTKVINDSDLTPEGSTLNFKTSLPILAEMYKNTKGETVVAWIDDENTPKIVNITSPSVERPDYELFPLGRLPIPEVSVVDSGGSLPSGVYRILYNCEDEDGSVSDFSVTSAPVSIVAGMSGASEIPFGSAPSSPTTKSILITIQPADSHWKYINIYVVKNINNQLSVAKVKRVPLKEQFFQTDVISGSPVGINEYGIVNINYAGTETEEPALLESVLTPNAIYTSAKAIGQLNNKLYLANLTTEEEILLQKYCTGITVQWKSRIPRATGSTIPNTTEFHVNSWKYPTFQHGEVYALYTQFRIKATGAWTKAFHIPGRDKIGGEDNVIAPSPSGTYKSGTGSPSFKLYQLEDTCFSSSYDTTGYGATGTMGFWENENEVYPDHEQFNGVDIAVPGGRDLRGQKVKHHKFPTIRFMKNTVYKSSRGFTQNVYGNSLDVLSLNVNLGTVFNQAYSGPGAIPPALLSKIDGWRILYAKRDMNNATVLGTSELFFYGTGFNTKELKPVVANGNADDVALDDHIALTESSMQYIRFHAFNLMVDKPNIAPTYLRQELLFKHICTTDAAQDSDPRLIVDTAGQLDADRKWLLFSSLSYDSSLTEPGMTGKAPQAVTSSYRFRAVEFEQYVPPGAIITGSTTINNSAGEEHVLLKQNYADLAATDKHMGLKHDGANAIWADNDFKHWTNLSSLCVIKTDVYTSFLTQPLVACVGEAKRQKTFIGLNYFFPVEQEFFGGDCWVGPHSVQTTGPVSDLRIVPSVGGELQGEGYKAVSYFWTVSAKNVNYRYASSDAQSAFYPHSPLFPKINNADYSTRFLGLQDLNKPLLYLYDPSFNTRNDLVTQAVYDPDLQTETQFPNTIISSEIQSTDTERISWRTFLAGNRYIMPRDKGEIINLQGVGNQRLYIHQRNGLFITKDRTTLKGDVVSVTLGSSDIFEVTPFEVLSTEDGFAGTQHKFGCVLTKIGYVFADAVQGKIFVHDGEKLEELSRHGLRQFWIENIRKDLPDNPFQGTGITIAYDEKYNRLLCTFNDSTNNKFVTASYSPGLNAWASYHDYDPSYMFSTRDNNVYSVKKNNKIYKHNVGEYGKYYQEDSDTTRFPLIVDALYNADAYNSKNFISVKWTTQVYNSAQILQPNSTFTSITVRSESKTTGKIILAHYLTMGDIYEQNTRLVDTTWNFNELRNMAVETPVSGIILDFYNNYELNPLSLDLTKDWYEQGRMRDNFVVCRFELDNLNNNQLILLDHDINFRKSYR